jgi:hypothetical protein
LVPRPDVGTFPPARAQSVARGALSRRSPRRRVVRRCDLFSPGRKGAHVGGGARRPDRPATAPQRSPRRPRETRQRQGPRVGKGPPAAAHGPGPKKRSPRGTDGKGPRGGFSAGTSEGPRVGPKSKRSPRRQAKKVLASSEWPGGSACDPVALHPC